MRHYMIYYSHGIIHFHHLPCSKSWLLTKNDGNFVRLSCFFDSLYFPTYNGINPFNEFECTESGWSLPVDMKPIQCKHVSCPPLLDVGDEVSLKCYRRDQACATRKPPADDINNE